MVREGQQKILMIARSDVYIPYDVQKTFRTTKLSFAKLFPRLNVLAVKDAADMDYNLLTLAYKNGQWMSNTDTDISKVSLSTALSYRVKTQNDISIDFYGESLKEPKDEMSLCHVEFLLGLLATGTAPIVGQVFESYTVVLCRVIDIATDGADVFTGGFFLFENHFGPYGGNGIVEVYHALGLQILVALRAVSAAIHRGMVTDEFTHSVQRLAGCWQVVINHRQFILIQRLVHVGDIAMKHVEQSVIFHHNDAVALGVALGLNQENAVDYLLTLGEIVVRPVCIAHWHKVRETLQLGSIHLVLVHIHLRIGE